MTNGSDTRYSSALKGQLSNAGTLLGALDAISNWRAFLLLAATFIAVVIQLSICVFISAQIAMRLPVLGGIFGFLSTLLAALIGLVGINATGIMYADEVWARPSRNPGQALMASLATSHRLILILLIEFVLFVAYLIALTIIFFICKLPFIGPLLYAIILPLGAIITGIFVFALAYIAVPLAAPAVWNGLTTKQALLMLKEIVRQHLLHVIVMMVLLGLLVGFVVAIICLILFSGIGISLSLSALVVGSSSSVSIVSMLMGAGGASGYAYALAFGFALLTLVGLIPGVLIGIKGASIIYREASSGISLDTLEAELQHYARQPHAQATPAAQTMHEEPKLAPAAPAAPSTPTPDTTAASPAAESLCPACQASITPADVFCGNCGHKLK